MPFWHRNPTPVGVCRARFLMGRHKSCERGHRRDADNIKTAPARPASRRSVSAAGVWGGGGGGRVFAGAGAMDLVVVVEGGGVVRGQNESRDKTSGRKLPTAAAPQTYTPHKSLPAGPTVPPRRPPVAYLFSLFFPPSRFILHDPISPYFFPRPPPPRHTHASLSRLRSPAVGRTGAAIYARRKGLSREPLHNTTT